MKKNIFLLSLIIICFVSATFANDHKKSEINVSNFLNSAQITKADMKQLDLLKLPEMKFRTKVNSPCIMSVPIYESCPDGGSVLVGSIDVYYDCSSGAIYGTNPVPSGRKCKVPIA